MHTPAMTRHFLLFLGLSIATAHASEPTPADLLRQGLFEEEANQNLHQAAEHYRAVIAAHERERVIAASATFRLGEIARKQNDKEAAAAAFRTIAERFPEQSELARLSRENLATLGVETPAPGAPASAGPEDAEIARLREIARNSPDLIDGADADGWWPIHHAAANGWSRVISYLLEHQAEPNRVTIKEQFTPLHLASVHGHLGAVKVLLAAGADPDVFLRFREEAMHALPAMDGRLEHGAGRWTALDLSIVYDRKEIALALIEAGTNIERVGPVVSERILTYRDGFNTLILAIYLQRDNLAKALIDAGSPLGAVGSEHPTTPLAVALISNIPMVATLLEAGADPNIAYSSIRIPPLHSAQSVKIAKLLVDAGADIHATTTEGETPLHWSHNAEMAEFLITKGLDPNAKDSSGLSPLDSAARRHPTEQNIAFIEALLKHGAVVTDPLELLRRTSESMVPFVGERLVYSNFHNPDAILLSASGNHQFSVVPPADFRSRSSRSTTPPELVTLETRASPACPPPSLAEVMHMAFARQSGYPQSIRILRRGENDGFEIIHEWSAAADNSKPTDWPALEWGDLVEVRNSFTHRHNALSVGDFFAMIPARGVTFRHSGQEMPVSIPGDGIFWLGSGSFDAFRHRLTEIEALQDSHRFSIHREGLSGPITIDLSGPPMPIFRLLDGDTVEILSDEPLEGLEIRITVTQEGIEIEGEPVTKKELEDKLRALPEGVRITVSAAPSVAFAKVVSILELLENSGHHQMTDFRTIGEAEHD